MPRKKAGHFLEQIDQAAMQPVREVMLGFGVKPEDWDVVVVGDGSGTGYNAACGWAGVLIDRHLKLRKGLHGGMNSGTSYLAELLPYLQALAWYAEGPGRAVLSDKMRRDPHARVVVHVVTDSEIVARQGSGRASRRKGRFYWAMIEALEQEGFVIHWHWKGRNLLAVNRLCDHIAGLSRKAMEALVAIVPPDGTSVYDYNPDSASEVAS